ncbi:MAG: DUF2156 domain-containing protein [Thermodesulfobacteriota bacterium]
MKLPPLLPERYDELQPFFLRQRYRLSIYSLSSLLVWRNEKFQPYAEVLDGALFIGFEFSDIRENRHLILPIAPDRDFPPAWLAAKARELGFHSYRFVPEDYLARYSTADIQAHFRIQEEPDFEDYIYFTADLAALAGNRYAKKRNLIKQFERTYLNADRVAVTAITPEAETECADFIEAWCLERDCGHDPGSELACEKIAAINALENLELVKMDGILIRVDGVVSALGIASRLTDDIGVLHFEKAFAAIKGLYQYLDRECARRLFSGYTYINKESDMGLPGLAKAKQSYFPALRVKSYDLKLKEG